MSLQRVFLSCCALACYSSAVLADDAYTVIAKQGLYDTRMRPVPS